MPKIHPTAIIDPAASIADDVEIGPYSIVESDVEIGSGCVLREHVVIRRYTTLGEGNFIDAGTVLGGDPQDLGWDPATVSYLRIGNGNILREGVTISRSSIAGQATIVGDKSYLMAYSHAAHDAVLGDEVVLCNSALVAGHARIGNRVFLSGHVAIHQYTWVGEGVMSRGNAAVSAHVPPFTTFANMNDIVGMNVIGMRRDESMTRQDRTEVKEAFRLTYRAGLTPSDALIEMDKMPDWGLPATQYREFIRKAISAEKPFNRGICPMRRSR